MSGAQLFPCLLHLRILRPLDEAEHVPRHSVWSITAQISACNPFPIISDSPSRRLLPPTLHLFILARIRLRRLPPRPIPTCKVSPGSSLSPSSATISHTTTQRQSAHPSKRQPILHIERLIPRLPRQHSPLLQIRIHQPTTLTMLAIPRRIIPWKPHLLPHRTTDTRKHPKPDQIVQQIIPHRSNDTNLLLVFKTCIGESICLMKSRHGLRTQTTMGLADAIQFQEKTH